MVALGCMSWLAPTNANAATASHRSPERTRPRLLPVSPALHATPLSPGAADGVLRARSWQAVATQSFIESSLLDPLADRLNCRFEFTRQRGDAAPAARQFNDSTPLFRCVWWMRSGHLENSFSLSPTPSTKLGQLQF